MQEHSQIIQLLLTSSPVFLVISLNYSFRRFLFTICLSAESPLSLVILISCLFYLQFFESPVSPPLSHFGIFFSRVHFPPTPCSTRQIITKSKRIYARITRRKSCVIIAQPRRRRSNIIPLKPVIIKFYRTSPFRPTRLLSCFPRHAHFS